AATRAGVGADQLLPRPTLFGSRSSSRLNPAALTRVLGTPSIPSGKSTPTATPPASDGESTRRSATADVTIPGVPASGAALRRVGIVVGCCALGALGALGVATHVGACGRPWP